MTSSSTGTSTWTIVNTATHIADVILGSIATILGNLGIDPTRLFADWSRDEAAIMAWIQERSLKAVILECHRPQGGVSPILEFPVTYTAQGAGDSSFTADRASLARYLSKIQRVPAGSTYKLLVTFSGPASAQPGWGEATRTSTSGMQGLSFGTLASGPQASAGMKYLRS